MIKLSLSSNYSFSHKEIRFEQCIVNCLDYENKINQAIQDIVISFVILKSFRKLCAFLCSASGN